MIISIRIIAPLNQNVSSHLHLCAGAQALFVWVLSLAPRSFENVDFISSSKSRTRNSSECLLSSDFPESSTYKIPRLTLTVEMDEQSADHAHWYLPVTLVCTILAFIAIVLRFYTRALLTRSIGSDDFALILPIVSTHHEHSWFWDSQSSNRSPQ